MRSDIRRKGPQPQAARALAHGEPQKLGSDASSGQRRLDVQLVDPVLIENKKTDERARLVLGEPQFGVGDHADSNPTADFIIGVDSRRDVRSSAAGPQPEVGYGVGITRRSSARCHAVSEIIGACERHDKYDCSYRPRCGVLIELTLS